MTLQIDRTLKWRRGAVRASGKPRSPVYEFEGMRAYAVMVDYFPTEDRLRVGYSVGLPIVPRPWLVVEEDPLDGLWLDDRLPVEYLIQDIPVAQRFLGFLVRTPEEKAAAAAVERLVGMLKDLDSLI